MTTRPSTIRTATYLLWLAVVLELISTFFSFELIADDRTARMAGLVLGLAFTGIAAVSTFFFSLGRNWARVALLVLFVMGILGGVVSFQPLLAESPPVAWLSVGQLSVSGVGLYLGYTKPGAAYFVATPGDDAAMRAILPVGRSGWAIAAGYLALFSVLLLPAPLALFCGVMAVRDIRRNPSKHGMGRAIFGVIMGFLGVLVIVILIWTRVSR